MYKRDLFVCLLSNIKRQRLEWAQICSVLSSIFSCWHEQLSKNTRNLLMLDLKIIDMDIYLSEPQGGKYIDCIQNDKKECWEQTRLERVLWGSILGIAIQIFVCIKDLQATVGQLIAPECKTSRKRRWARSFPAPSNRLFLRARFEAWNRRRFRRQSTRFRLIATTMWTKTAKWTLKKTCVPALSAAAAAAPLERMLAAALVAMVRTAAVASAVAAAFVAAASVASMAVSAAAAFSATAAAFSAAASARAQMEAEVAAPMRIVKLRCGRATFRPAAELAPGLAVAVADWNKTVHRLKSTLIAVAKRAAAYSCLNLPTRSPSAQAVAVAVAVAVAPS